LSRKRVIHPVFELVEKKDDGLDRLGQRSYSALSTVRPRSTGARNCSFEGFLSLKRYAVRSAIDRYRIKEYYRPIYKGVA